MRNEITNPNDESLRAWRDVASAFAIRPSSFVILCALLLFINSLPAAVSTPFGTSYQVNVDAFGQNIAGDAANEPSLCIDPTNPNRIAVGWRQFNTTNDSFRQAGWGYSTNG